MNSQELKIFLSSTYIDLKDAREKILKFLGVLKSDVINMELFGSDESQPKSYCLQKVIESNFFIGIYAERYGFIDPDTGVSITQLEYIEAYKKFKDGSLKGLLIYVLDRNASWPVINIDRDPERVEKMAAFKAEIMQRHTISYFKDIDELPFNILRDTIRKLEVGQQKYFKGRAKEETVFKQKMDKPIGMEFFNQELANMFYGRALEIESLMSQILSHNFSLLIGISGIGKTSLLNAGLITSLNRLGWITSILRPLNDPLNNLKKMLWNSLMDGQCPSEFDIVDIIRAVLTTCNGKKVIIIIDQFEDILNCKNQQEIDSIVSNLMRIHGLKAFNLHVLISYRGDVEADLGGIWQKISGAADGLPRFYLKALNQSSAKEILEKTLDRLGINLVEGAIIDTIIGDLHIESLSNGHTDIFPPFLQMVIVTIYEHCIQKKKSFDIEIYLSLEGCKGIIGDYLLTQLNYLGSLKDAGIKTLVALVSNYGTKTQKTIDDIEFEAQIPNHTLISILAILTDLRLIRGIDNYYEITHDLLAKNILSNLITNEELNIRKFKFLLESKAAAYESTKGELTLLEHLYLFKYRKRISCSKEEVKLMLHSRIKHNTPIFFWLNKENIMLDSTMRLSLDARPPFLYPYSIIKYVVIPKAGTKSNLEKIVISLSRSTRQEKLSIFYDYALKYTSDFNRFDCVNFIASNKQWKKMIGIIGLGLLGTKNDIKTLKEFILKDSSFKVRLVSFRSILSIIKRLGIYGSLSEILFTYPGPYFDVTAEDFDPTLRNYLKIDAFLNELLPKPPLLSIGSHRERTRFLLNVLGNITTKDDLKEIESLVYTKLSKEVEDISLDYSVYLELLLKFASNFKYIIDLIFNTNKYLKVSYMSHIHERIAALSTENDYSFIKEFIISDVNRLGLNYPITDKPFNYENNIKVPDNFYLLQWIMGVAFCRLTERSNKGLIFRLLNHNLYTLRNAATRALYSICIEDDLDELISMALDNPSNSEIIMTISLLDRKFYLTNDIRKLLKLRDENHIEEIEYLDHNSQIRAIPMQSSKHYSALKQIVFDDDLPF